MEVDGGIKSYNCGCPLQCLLAFSQTYFFVYMVWKTIPWICYLKEKWVFPDFKYGPLLEDLIVLAMAANIGKWKA